MAANMRVDQVSGREQRTVLRALAESATRDGCRMLEIGSWCGDSALILGKAARRHGGRLFCVDWWKGSVETDLAEVARQEDVFSVFWRRIVQAGLEDVVVPIRASSDVAAEVLRPETMDLVFIDGDHRYEQVRRDIANYSSLVRPDGGVLCGHDCEARPVELDRKVLEAHRDADFHKGLHCGVILAVDDAFASYSVNCAIWSVRRDRHGRWQPTDLHLPELPNSGESPPVRLEGGTDFNVIRFRGEYFALVQGDGELEWSSATDKTFLQFERRGLLIRASTPGEARRLGKRMVARRGASPRLAQQNARFNVLHDGDEWYAVSNLLGPMNIRALTPSAERDLERAGLLAVRDSLEAARQAARNFRGKTDDAPVLAESYADFDIYAYGRWFIASALPDAATELAAADADHLARLEAEGVVACRTHLDEARAAGDKLLPVRSQQPVLLASATAYDLICYQGRVCAVSHLAGPLDLATIGRDALAKLEAAGLLAWAETLEAARAAGDAMQHDASAEPVLLEEHETFNLVLLRGTYVAAPHWSGEMDLGATTEEELSEMVRKGELAVCRSLEEARRQGAGLLPPGREGQVLLESYRGYNLISENGAFLAVAHGAWEGPITEAGAIHRDRLARRDLLVEADSHDAVRRAVDAICDRDRPMPVYLETRGGYAVLTVGEAVWAIPEGTELPDPARTDVREALDELKRQDQAFRGADFREAAEWIDERESHERC